MSFTAEQQRAYRKQLRADGICTGCHKTKTVGGRSICAACISKMNAKRDKYRAEGGRCIDCCRVLVGVDAGSATCASCLELQSIRQRMKRSWS